MQHDRAKVGIRLGPPPGLSTVHILVQWVDNEHDDEGVPSPHGRSRASELLRLRLNRAGSSAGPEA